LSKSPITITARKFDGSVHRSWKAELIERNGPLLVFLGEFEMEVNHPQVGVIRRGTLSYEYYWLDRWYSVFRFHEPGGVFRNYYCNINMPPKFENEVLDYVDLDLDVLADNKGTIEILDRTEYESNLKRYGYSDKIQKNVSDSLDELLQTIKNRDFPFDLDG